MADGVTLIQKEMIVNYSNINPVTDVSQGNYIL